MLLEEIIRTDGEGPVRLMRPGFYADAERANLVRDLIALANVDEQGPRYLIFGVEPRGDSIRVQGCPGDILSGLRRAQKEAVPLIEPRLSLVPISAEINGRTVAAFEISSASNRPYMAGGGLAGKLQCGDCWVLEDGLPRRATRSDFDRFYGREPLADFVPVSIGLGDDPLCQVMPLTIPDRSSPPSGKEGERLKAMLKVRAAKRLIGEQDSGMARLVHMRLNGPDVPYNPAGTDTLVGQYNEAKSEYHDADQHYYYEQCAVRLNLTALNNLAEPLEDAVIEFVFPRTKEFDIADCIYPGADDSGALREASLMGYPNVKKSEGSIRVRATPGQLPPNVEVILFESDLRLAVGPGMHQRKIAVRYAMAARGLDKPVRGRLKLSFSQG